MTATTDLTIPCLSLWEPWASLVIAGAKQYETRFWATNYRGPLLIHASKTLNAEIKEMLTLPTWRRILSEAGIRDLTFSRTRGHILGLVNLRSCLKTEAVRDRISPKERALGDYTQGRFAWLLEQPAWLPDPIPYKGQRSLFQVPVTDLPQVAELLEVRAHA